MLEGEITGHRRGMVWSALHAVADPAGQALDDKIHSAMGRAAWDGKRDTSFHWKVSQEGVEF